MSNTIRIKLNGKELTPMGSKREQVVPYEIELVSRREVRAPAQALSFAAVWVLAEWLMIE
ncbi:hypothetical protein [Ammoniphilus sp. CFH 90114]|uniref:hypothetical protein n=1 Tax=Ammoniphilus sp. CFH 90114 TaxID=2493665 RepID=UPI00100EB4A0|nr:hypothetical protein [Ammoniphilus sp. CFH 90114]RXT04256.1 hypothetical protein EIZ39_20450 [Ammoniphilus sp. CFH 90114]